MLNLGIIWRGWLVLRDVFHVVPMLCLVLFVYLSFISTSANCKSIASRNTLFISPILFTHLFSHSRKTLCIAKSAHSRYNVHPFGRVAQLVRALL